MTQSLYKTRFAWFALCAFLAMSFSLLIAFAQSAQARISNKTGDEVVTSTDTEDNVFAHMVLANISAATSTVLVDLSDNNGNATTTPNTNFKHTASSGSIDISQIRMTWQTNSTATTSTDVRIGVIASTSPSGAVADIYWFDSFHFFAGADSTPNIKQERALERVITYSPSALKTRITSAAPAKFITNDRSLSSTLFATTTILTSPRGSMTVFPATGDVVMQIYSQTSNATTSASVLYRVTE